MDATSTMMMAPVKIRSSVLIFGEVELKPVSDVELDYDSLKIVLEDSNGKNLEIRMSFKQIHWIELVNHEEQRGSGLVFYMTNYLKRKLQDCLEINENRFFNSDPKYTSLNPFFVIDVLNSDYTTIYNIRAILQKSEQFKRTLYSNLHGSHSNHSNPDLNSRSSTTNQFLRIISSQQWEALLTILGKGVACKKRRIQHDGRESYYVYGRICAQHPNEVFTIGAIDKHGCISESLGAKVSDDGQAEENQVSGCQSKEKPHSIMAKINISKKKDDGLLKLANKSGRIKKRKSQSKALKETICRMKMEQYQKEFKWKKEKEILLQKLNNDREKDCTHNVAESNASLGEIRRENADTIGITKKWRGQSKALEYLIGQLNETVRLQKIEHSKIEAEFEKEKQILLRNLNIEREKYRLLTTRISEAVKDSDSIAQTQLLASSGQPPAYSDELARNEALVQRILIPAQTKEPPEKQPRLENQEINLSAIPDVVINANAAEELSGDKSVFTHNVRKKSRNKYNGFGRSSIEERRKMLEKFDNAVNGNKEQIKELFPRFPVDKPFEEYNELHQMFSVNPENEQIFESMIRKSYTLKLLEHILRYTELVLYEVKSGDSGQSVRRSERNYISWAEEQRRLLFAKNKIQLDSAQLTRDELLRFFDEHQKNVKDKFFPELTDEKQEMIEKFAVVNIHKIA